ncbi:ribonuclease P protein component [Halotalea alkalilenta]|uniref:ribonuclease P protein component n=1 Tax=Halotalea alkalilenta TaxID=376489 RepID=UPI000489BC30|nr:ribonuclease P protein component [Halotalea alkalilenta]
MAGQDAIHGFPRSLRILTSGEYGHVFEHACFKVHGKGLLALACPNQHGHVRVGLVFSRKNVRRAVDRNLLKRLTRESIRLRQHRLPAVDIVVLSRRGVLELDRETLSRQLAGMWRRLEQDVKRRAPAPDREPA